ncbi:gag/pol protein [Cucumis melo var. makuwa]|uniref:Gag/pol protein n=1 Tax=Cucumis melo var. makuwa TaxID=1194695 RepID=A0A5A7SV81_CUCMM|nr:gag/pol protein [Cucumis melo var. makuwa]TYJ98808.1 gag/pol protein [Cucumis melo var. makuwa]
MLDLWPRVIPKEKEWTMKKHSLLLSCLSRLEYYYPSPPSMIMIFGRWRKIPYASFVGSLMYTMLCTRHDICFSVGMVSRYVSIPGRDHWTTVKNILKYLRRTKDYMLVYGTKDLILTGYTDSDFQTNKDARKSTSGSVFTLNGEAVV